MSLKNSALFRPERSFKYVALLSAWNAAKVACYADCRSGNEQYSESHSSQFKDVSAFSILQEM